MAIAVATGSTTTIAASTFAPSTTRTSSAAAAAATRSILLIHLHGLFETTVGDLSHVKEFTGLKVLTIP